MLQSIRDRLTGPIVWFVVGLIAIPFAFWGIESFRTGDGDPTVVKVGDQDITQSQLRQTYEQRYQQYRSLLGESFRAESFDEARFRQLTLDDMVQESALRQYARAQGYRSGDTALRDFLMTVPAFQKDGSFSPETYRELLARQNLRPDGYEEQLRDALAIDQLRNAVQNSAFVAADEAWAAYRLEQQTRTVAVLPLLSSNFVSRVNPGDEQIAERYENSKTQYLSQERLKLEYVELDRATLATAEAPAREVLKALYDAERESRFTSAEERRARHILIAFGADKSAARQKADKLLASLREGADFAELARENSDDPGSKGEGGDLGLVRKGVMAPKFEEALFAMKAGEIAGPVETEFGWHLIRLDEIKAPAVRAFDEAEVQTELLETYRAREGEKRFQDMSAKLEQLAFENTSLTPVAAALGLEIKTSDWITRSGGSGIAENPAIRSAAFAPEVLQDGENSKPLPASADALVVIRKKEYEPARQLALDEVRNRVRDALVAEAATEQARKAAETALAQLREGKALQDVAQAQGLTLQFEGEARRDLGRLDGPVLSAIFSMPRPKDGTVQSQLVENGPGNFAVVALSAVTDPARPEDAAVLEPYVARARERVAGAEFSAYRKAIEASVKVKTVNAPAPLATAENPEP